MNTMFEIITMEGRVLGPFTARELREAAQALNDKQREDDDAPGWDARVVGCE